MFTRPATASDLAALTELQRAYDVLWFGVPEHDADEVAEQLEPIPDLATHTLTVWDDERTQLLGVLWWWGQESHLVVGPVGSRREVVDLLVDHAAASGVTWLASYAGDTDLLDSLTVRGWRHWVSGFDMLRTLTDDWQLPTPTWPAGVELRGLREDDHHAVHELIYTAAGWAEIPGHVFRDEAEWRSLFLSGPTDPTDQVVAWRGERPVGVALHRSFSDGTGWISQLAVAATERGQGLGRALLLEGLRRRRDAGASQLGLGVQAANATALRLYESVGLRIEREFGVFRPGGAD